MIPISGKRHTKGHLKVCTVLMLILELCLAAMSCSGKTDSGKGTADEIRIGMINTTIDKSVEASIKDIMEMISRRLGSDGGLVVGGKRFPVIFVVRGIDGFVPEQAVQAAKELINQENVVAIVGPLTSADAIPAGEVAERSGIPLISPTSTHPRTTAGKKYVFRMTFLDDFQAESMARFALEDLSAPKAAVLFNITNPYSRELAEVFRDTIRREGGNVVSYESYITGDSDIAAQLERIHESQPDVLLMPNDYKEAVIMIPHIREAKIDAILLGGDAWNANAAKDIPEFEGAYMVDYVSLDALEGESKAFVERYESRYGHAPDTGAILFFDAFKVLLRAIQHAESFEPGTIRDALYALGPYEGVGGRIDFVNSGDPKRGGVILRFEDSKIKFVKRIFPASPERGMEK